MNSPQTVLLNSAVGPVTSPVVTKTGARIDAEGIEVSYGKHKVLNGVALSVLPNECVGILGASGGGKSTLLKVLAGLMLPQSGLALVDGASLDSLPLGTLGFVPQDDIVHSGLSVRKALQYAAALRLGPSKSEDEIDRLVVEVMNLVGLAEHAPTRVGRLSGGQRKRVSVAVELLGQPRVLFLDEPTSGLDPALEGQFMRLFGELSKQGHTCVLTTHVTLSLSKLDIVGVLAAGNWAWYGPPNLMLPWFGVDDPADIYEVVMADGARFVERFSGSVHHYRYLEQRSRSL